MPYKYGLLMTSFVDDTTEWKYQNNILKALHSNEVQYMYIYDYITLFLVHHWTWKWKRQIYPYNYSTSRNSHGYPRF